MKLISLDASKHILDVGTGSGCILLSLIKRRSKCHGTAIDISKKALKVAKLNAKMHHLENKINCNIDIDKFKLNKYDFIVSNPPYINKIDLRLDNDIKLYEPLEALEAGIDGLSEVIKLIKQSNNLLKKNGKLVFEIGKNQVDKVTSLLKKKQLLYKQSMQGYSIISSCDNFN